YRPISSIPRASPERLALASPDKPPSPDAANTILYLAYGSNLCAETFLVGRGIRPISQINVSAPSFDLTFDLPGIPYSEPCFANIAPRKLPKPPPIDDPTKPPIGPPPHNTLPSLPVRRPTWSKGLIGVVYEVSPTDYATIINTEGGGAGYQDILAPCVALPPPFQIPEKPPVPEIPKPFLAHTLYAPRLPADPPTDRWYQKFLTPVRRPEADYAQPSPRYLKKIRDGAAEHYLPDEYQAYLARLDAYEITRRKQEVGKWLFFLLWSPVFATMLALAKLLADEKGRVPRWLGVTMSVFFNMIWMSYDRFFKSRFGDGERTMEDD
ncbi:uncharacterized protein BCR38DRAFT_327419, partial [Pseudomassariella vexata]